MPASPGAPQRASKPCLVGVGVSFVTLFAGYMGVIQGLTATAILILTSLFGLTLVSGKAR